MAGMIYDFIETLKLETEEYRKLAEVGSIKSGHLVKGSLKELSDINIVETHIVSKLRSLEKKRDELLNDISDVLNIDKNEATVTKVEQALMGQPDEAKALRDAKVKLTEALRELDIINRTNTDLINQSIEYANYSLNMLQSAMGDAPMTADYGANAEHRKNSVFDKKN